MGRGLSDLQRWIVEEARSRSHLPASERRLYYADICERYFGWERRKNGQGEPRGPGSQQFSRKEIGAQEYNRVKATVSRSCARLEQRGLVQCIQGATSRWAAVEAVEE